MRSLLLPLYSPFSAMLLIYLYTMPLHIGPDVYNEIRGPYTFFLLRPIREPDCTFLLLGEEHKHEHWMPCEDTPNCANVQLEFVASLNKVAEHRPVEIFLESFFEGPKYMQTEPLNREALNYMDYQVSALRSVTHLRKEEKYNATTNFIHQGSPMLEVAQLYKYCFLPSTRKTERCIFPHLKWNYADARRQNKLSYSGISSAATIYADIIRTLHQYRRGTKSGLNTTLLSLDPDFEDETDWKDDFLDGITEPILTRLCKRATSWMVHNLSVKRPTHTKELFATLLERLRSILADPKDVAYIDKIVMESQDNVIYEQYKSLPPELRTVFTHRSFVKLQKVYKDKFPDREEEIEYAIRVLDLFIEYNQIIDDPAQKDRRVEIARELMSMEYADEQLKFIQEVFMYYTALSLDIYFILRSYNRAKTSKTVVGFFGSAHTDSIVKYFVNIVKTHRIEYETAGDGLVRIEPEIHLLPVAGLMKRTRVHKKKKSKGKGTRKN